ncbi:hypothetical protein [Mesorhizobium sp.]|uniref:hypothetical protein n=1 Tax=Mesorhizobium sp. TaxID=1871066 RepID=UPI0025E88EC4|nr:hypothetical protein [Mesorhizobium sp.]
MSANYRIAVTWRGPGNVRQDQTETVNGLSQISEVLGRGPDGWTVAYVTITELTSRRGG